MQTIYNVKHFASIAYTYIEEKTNITKISSIISISKGYPLYTGELLLKYYTTYNKVQDLFSYGNMIILNETVEKSRFYLRDDCVYSIAGPFNLNYKMVMYDNKIVGIGNKGKDFTTTLKKTYDMSSFNNNYRKILSNNHCYLYTDVSNIEGYTGYNWFYCCAENNDGMFRLLKKVIEAEKIA